VGGKRVAVIHAMEYGRMLKESAFDEILLLNEVRDGAAKRFNLSNGKEPGLHEMVMHLAETYRMVHVAPGGCELLSRAPYKWEIP